MEEIVREERRGDYTGSECSRKGGGRKIGRGPLGLFLPLNALLR